MKYAIFNFNLMKYQKGVAALLVSIVLLSLTVVFIPAVVFLTQSNLAIIQNQIKISTSYYAAEAAVEDTIYRIKKGMRYSETNSLNVEGAVASVNISGPAGQKIITVQAQDQNRYRKIEAVLAIDGTFAEFHYGVLAGNGGFNMENNTKIIGSVYANGNITGSNLPEITGDAFVASTSSISGMKIGGQARGYSIANSQVSGDVTMANLMDNTSSGRHAYAANIRRSQIIGNATYITIDGQTTVGGQRIATTTAPEPLPVQPFPISEEQLDEWQSEAEAGGVINSPCPYVISSGTVTLGPKKINCDLIVRGSGILVLSGPIWVKGNIVAENSGQIKLAGYFGAHSSFIIANDPADRLNKGKIEVRNSAQFSGSGTTGSYLLAVSRNRSAAQGGTIIAVSIGNSSNTSVFYAPEGLIDIGNNVNLREATGYKIKIQNGATITYESGLANLLFTSGPTAGWNLIDWQEKL